MLVAMASCTRDEVVSENKGQAISIRTAVETRGLETMFSTMESIYVTALEDGTDTPYFFKVPFVLSGYDNYVSNDTYYWPGQGRKLKFYAYAPSEAVMGATVTLTNDEKSLKGFVVKENISEQIDFVYAVNDGDEGAGLEEQTSVPLTFHHKLSKVSVKGCTSSDYVYKIAGVRLAGVYGKGDLDLTTNEWTIDENDGKKKYVKELAADEIVTLNKETGRLDLMGELLNLNDYPIEDYAFMLPQTFKPWDPATDRHNEQGGAYVAVKVQISTTAGTRVYPAESEGEYAWVAIPLTGSAVENESGLYQWIGDSAYYYTLNFTNGAGYVEPDINNPQSGTPVLGDGASIKMTMTLPEMEEGVEDMVVNPNMLGVWTAYKFSLQQTYYKALVDENEEFIYDENGERQFALDENGERIVVWSKTTELEGADIIGPQIDNFARITILDGMYLRIKNSQGEETKVRYYVNDENYILIECYRCDGEEGSLNEDYYSPAPYMESIIPATATSDGHVTVKVDGDDYGWSDPENGVEDPYLSEERMTILYDVAYLNTDSE